MRAKFDPQRVIARPRPVALKGRRVGAEALLRGGLPGTLSSSLIVEFDTLGHAARHAERYASLVAALHARGVVVHGVFTLGYDHDDASCFEQLVAWVEAVGLARVELRLWTPTPGTGQARALARAGRVRHLDYARWDGSHVVVEPLTMSPETLQRGWAWAQRRLDSPISRLRRRAGRLGPIVRAIDALANRSFANASPQLLTVSRPGFGRARGGV